MSDIFDEKEVDTGAGVSFSSRASSYAVPTPPASVYGNQQPEVDESQELHEYTTVNMEIDEDTSAAAPNQGKFFGGNNNNAGGFSLPGALGLSSAPFYIRIQEDPEEVENKKKSDKIKLALYIIFFLLIFILPAFVNRNPAGGPHHQLIKNCNVKFEDVHGCDEVKGQLQNIVKYLKDPETFEYFDAKMPRGYLLTGPPGVGKTMLAKAVAGESGVAFLTISGAEFDEFFVGVGSSRVRNLFSDARKFGKAVIFIDEIDAIAGKRGGLGENSALRQTLNQLLVEMDGFNTGDGIVVLAATNMADSLDPAIVRPGRFDKTFVLRPPDLEGRTNLLNKLFEKISKEKLDEKLKKSDFNWLARITTGYTGADLANLVNHAKLIASEDNSQVITKEHLMKAKHFVDLGPESNMKMDIEDERRTAYHEAGHAIMALINQKTCKDFAVEYATIVPHGQSLGLITHVPQKDLKHMSLEMLKQKMYVLLGGFMGEKLYFKGEITQVSTGASSDLKQLNSVARAIVEAGFGPQTGFLQMNDNPALYSEDFKCKFEADMKHFLEEAKTHVEKQLKLHDRVWRALAKELLENKSLSKDQIAKIFKDNEPTDKEIRDFHKIISKNKKKLNR